MGQGSRGSGLVAAGVGWGVAIGVALGTLLIAPAVNGTLDQGPFTRGAAGTTSSADGDANGAAAQDAARQAQAANELLAEASTRLVAGALDGVPVTIIRTADSADGDLSSWSRQGILLLNRVLTVRPGKPASHRGKGWEPVTEAAIRALSLRDAPLVAILWGRDAQQAQRFLGETPVIASAHPSPLSASRGFFGSRPFSRANEALERQGAQAVDWSL